MNCQRCRERLQEYLDGTLEMDEQSLVSVHVAACEACRRELDELRKLAALVGSLDEVPEPAGFLQAVRERIDRPTVWERLTAVLRRPLRPGVSIGIPVIIVAFIAVFAIMTNLHETTRPAQPTEKGQPAEQFEIAKAVESSEATPSEPTSTFSFNRHLEPSDEAGSRGELGEIDADEGFASRGLSRDRSVSKGGAAEAEATESTGELKADARSTLNQEVRAGEDAEPEETSAGAEETIVLSGRAGGTTVESDEAAGQQRVDQIATKDEKESVLDLAEESGTREDQPKAGFVGAMWADTTQQTQGETVIELLVKDLPTDLTNVYKIVKEEGGSAKEVREQDALTLVNLYFTVDTYDKAVERLNLYNEQNKQELERKQRSRTQETETDGTGKAFGSGAAQKALKTLTLVVRRIVEQAPGADSESESE